MIMMCGPTWNSSRLPVACDVFATQKPPYIYEIPTLCTLGVRPDILYFMNCRKTWSKQPGSSWVASGRPGRQLHPLVPSRRTRNSPPGEDGQSSTVAFCVTNFGPARIADAIFSASDFEGRDAGISA